LGDDVILKQLKEGVSRKRVGLVLDSGVCRENAPVLAENGKDKIGVVTSGGYSPSLKKAIAMAYVDSASAALGTKVQIGVRDRHYNATVSKMPFIKTNYFKVQ
jgi:aminomethyltransferase